jgi:DNA-3-methyladenine glycosylase II
LRAAQYPAGMPRLTKAHAALAESDPVMAALMERLGPMSVAERRRRRNQKPQDAYGALLRAVVGQQLSTKAARTIYERVLELFGGEDPSPEALLDVEEKKLRAAGLSGRKVEYLRDLAAHVISGELELERLDQLSDEDVIEEITAVRGFGQWTAEMFLMFHLGRKDVVSGGDLGIRKAIQIEYGLDEMPKPEEVVERSEAWRPNRTLACIYLWESLAAVPVETTA